MAQISLPNQLVNGTVADASQVMANFNSIVNVVNGNLGSDNIKAISGNDITVKSGIGGGNETLNQHTERIQVGTFRPPDIPKGQRLEFKIKFPKPFPGTPRIFLQPKTQYPERRFCGVINWDKNGFDVVYFKTEGSAGPYTVEWMAVYQGAM